ncbi:MAG: bifunctional tetrahydrofolate synthase/dihydrofolate synthase [Gammaproteobacteria bacterium]
MPRSLAEWLRWQEALNPREIDLGLDRVRDIAADLPIAPPAGAVFTVAGTNGKGSTVAYIEGLLAAGGYRTGVYTSPHLVRYNERVVVDGVAAADDELTDAFTAIEAVRGRVPLTFFEFGTLAALLLFSARRCDAWVLEIGLGGRLDAVNVIDPDFSLITSIALDHQDWLGDTIEDIAAEKAGIMRADAPAFYGDSPVPDAIGARAAQLGARLYRYGQDFAADAVGDSWAWRGETCRLHGLAAPEPRDDAGLRNLGIALAALEQFDPALLTTSAVDAVVAGGRPAGRFQLVDREPQWILDVAHNPQAAGVLADRLRAVGARRDTTAVVGMLADKPLDEFVDALAAQIDRWIVAPVDDPRAADPADMCERIRARVDAPVECANATNAAFGRAEALTPSHGRVLCCGSFRIVGPAIEWLGLYS